jgi:uncharacterized protein (TIGR02117 family)
MAVVDHDTHPSSAQVNAKWSIGHWLRFGARGLVSIVAVYAIALLFGSLLPVNGDWREVPVGDNSVEIFLFSNGIHTAVVVPVSASGVDFSDLVPPSDLPDPALYGTHLAIGWGHAEFYRNTPSWRDVRAADLASAFVGSRDTLVHVDHVISPIAAPNNRPLRISVAQWRAMAARIRASFARDADGHSISSAGYGPTDRFYVGRGWYNAAIYSCNNWTGDMLKSAGVRTGIWTPIASGVMRWVPVPAAAN